MLECVVIPTIKLSGKNHKSSMESYQNNCGNQDL